MDYVLIGCLFISIMATKFVWDLSGWLEKKTQPKKTESELWTEQYEKDVPTVWK